MVIDEGKGEEARVDTRHETHAQNPRLQRNISEGSFFCAHTVYQAGERHHCTTRPDEPGSCSQSIYTQQVPRSLTAALQRSETQSGCPVNQLGSLTHDRHDLAR